MANSAALGLIPSLLGLATSIGTAIPGLKKPKRTKTSQRAALEASGAAGRAAVGASQTGRGASRGLALRSGLRASSEAAKQGAGVAAAAADRDEARFQAELTQRNKRLAQFGGDLASFGSTLGTGIVEARAAKAAEEGGPFALEQTAAAPETSPTARQIGGAGNVVQPSIQELAQQPQQQQLAQGPQQIDQAVPGVPEAPQTQLQGPTFDPVRASLGMSGLDQLEALAPQAEFQLRAQNLALQEAERQGVPISRVLAQLNRQMGNVPQLQDPGELDFEGF